MTKKTRRTGFVQNTYIQNPEGLAEAIASLRAIAERQDRGEIPPEDYA